MTSSTMNFNELVAIDTHVHLHGDTSGNPADEAARKYFGRDAPLGDPGGASLTGPVGADTPLVED